MKQSAYCLHSAVGIRVLSIENELASDSAPWRKVHRACTNLEAVHLAVDSSSTEAIDVLTLVRTKLVSLQMHNLDDLMPTEERLFSLLPVCSMEEVELHVLPLVPKELLPKLFESLKSVTTLKCITHASDVNSNKDIIDVIACTLTRLESFTASTETEVKGMM